MQPNLKAFAAPRHFTVLVFFIEPFPNGEVQIYQDDLDGFLNIAHRFKIKGLQSNENHTPDDTFETKHKIESPKDLLMTNVQKESKVSKNNENALVPKRHDKNNTIAVIDPKSDWKQEADKYIERLEDGSLRCSVCGKICSDKNRSANMRQHIEIHLDGYSYECDLCDKSFRSSNAQRFHNKRYH